MGSRNPSRAHRERLAAARVAPQGSAAAKYKRCGVLPTMLCITSEVSEALGTAEQREGRKLPGTRHHPAQSHDLIRAVFGPVHLCCLPHEVTFVVIVVDVVVVPTLMRQFSHFSNNIKHHPQFTYKHSQERVPQRNSATLIAPQNQALGHP